MSDQHSPFVVERPDGFIGVEVSVSDQLTVHGARRLAHQLLVAALAAERKHADRRAAKHAEQRFKTLITEARKSLTQRPVKRRG